MALWKEDERKMKGRSTETAGHSLVSFVENGFDASIAPHNAPCAMYQYIYIAGRWRNLHHQIK